MHPSALENFEYFVKSYLKVYPNNSNTVIVDIGSQDVNGSLKTLIPSGMKYIGVDFILGKNVDIVLTDPYQIPIDSNSVDVVVSSSCFEHSEMFWLTFLEIMRILKPNGLFYLNVPSNGPFHRYPTDCWRFYPDSGKALEKWAKRNNIDAMVIESYISNQISIESHRLLLPLLWNDFVAVFIKDSKHVGQFIDRITNHKKDFTNGLVYPNNFFINFKQLPEDQRLRN